MRLRQTAFRSVLAAGAALALVLAGCGNGDDAPSGSAGTITLRIAEQAPCACQLAFYVATDQGFFKGQGLEPSFVKEPTPLTGVLTNAAEMSMASPGQAALAKGKGADIRVVVTAQSRLTQALFVRTGVPLSDPSNWQKVVQDLKGKKIGITTRGGSTDTNLRFILSQAGLSPDTDVQIVPLGAGPSMIAGVQAGQVDAALSFQPLTATMLAQNLGTVAIDLAKGQGPASLDQPMTTGLVRGEWAQQNPDAVKKVAAATDEAMTFMKDPANRDRVLEIARQHLAGTNDETLHALLDQLEPLLRPTYTEEDNTRVNDVLVQSKLLNAPVAYDQMITAETPQ